MAQVSEAYLTLSAAGDLHIPSAEGFQALTLLASKIQRELNFSIGNVFEMLADHSAPHKLVFFDLTVIQHYESPKRIFRECIPDIPVDRDAIPGTIVTDNPQDDSHNDRHKD